MLVPIQAIQSSQILLNSCDGCFHKTYNLPPAPLFSCLVFTGGAVFPRSWAARFAGTELRRLIVRHDISESSGQFDAGAKVTQAYVPIPIDAYDVWVYRPKPNLFATMERVKRRDVVFGNKLGSATMKPTTALKLILLSLGFIAGSASAATVLFNNDFPDGKIGTASRPDSGNGERETGDDFLLSTSANVTGAAFTGLIPTNASIKSVVVEIYRVFPKDSDVTRTSGPPTFSNLPQIPTRVNSPSDVAFDSRESGSGLQYIATPLQNSFTVNNSIVNGISVGAGGEGPVTGQEVRFNVAFSTPFTLPADHYFFVPQVELSNGDFLWLSANRPIVPPGTPFAPDLQSWIRNDPGIAPDWLRVGTDVVGSTTFNASFLLVGDPVPEPSSYALLVLGLGFIGARFASRKSNHV